VLVLFDDALALLRDVVRQDRWILASDVHRHVLGRPDLPVGVRVRRAHLLAAVLEDLHVADPWVGHQLRVLIRPDLDDPLDRVERQLAEAEVVARRVADDAARPVLAVLRRNQRRVVVREDERLLVLRVPLAARALVARAEVAARVVLVQPLACDFVHVSLPRPLRALRRDEHPFAAERVVSSVRVHAHTFAE
jgi:hypothetical protein